MVLFYREHKSIEHVAADLDLSQDAVKQRLSRGRKLLREEVAAFVEGALERTNPGGTFTLGVLAALPAFPASTNAATIGGVIAKTSSLAKSAGLAGAFNAVVGLVSMVLGAYFGYKLDREGARSQQERETIATYYRALIRCSVFFGLSVLSFVILGWQRIQSHPRLFAGAIVGFGILYVAIGTALTFHLRKKLRDFDLGPDKAAANQPLLVPIFEYRSGFSLFGWPLVHIRLRGGLERGPVKAWVAAGDAAIGLIFAFGAFAIAPISFGGFALGLLTLGGIAIGGMPIGGFSLGLYALGGLAVGLQAYGGCAIAWTAAEGSVAVAHDFAVGAVASARHVNDAAAKIFVQDSGFFQCALLAMRYAQWLNLLWLFPFALWWQKRRTPGSTTNPVGM